MTDYFQSSRKSLVEHMNSDIDSRWNEPATRGDLRNALIRIESKFDSLRNYIDSQAFKTTQK